MSLCADQYQKLLRGELSPAYLPVHPPGSEIRVVFPGSFNPLHAAHLEMARLARSITGYTVSMEIAVVNADKPSITFEEVCQRASADFCGHGLLLTCTPLFVEKAGLFPESVFVVGADTIERINMVRYYGSRRERDQSISEIADAGCRFLVYSRKSGKIEKAGNIVSDIAKPDIEDDLNSICTHVPPEQFMMDVSSSEIRERKIDSSGS